MARLRCAILDDYQRVALAMADWPSLDSAVTTLHDRLATEDDAVAALGTCDIVVAMRERTAFRASLLARLPRLRLLVTTGMRNAAIDVPAAIARGITVCGTASEQTASGLTWALILALARHLVPEQMAFRTGGPWQSTVGSDLQGRRLGLLGLGKIGQRVARVGRRSRWTSWPGART